MSWLLMWTLSPNLGACTILHWSLLHLPAKLRGGDACQKGLSPPPLSKQETHTREQAACKAGGEELLAFTILNWSLSCTCQASSEGEMLARRRLTQVSKQVVKEERKGEQAGREMEQETHTRERAEEPPLVSLEEEMLTRKRLTQGGKERKMMSYLLAPSCNTLSYICQEEDACQQVLPSRRLTQESKRWEPWRCLPKMILTQSNSLYLSLSLLPR